MLCENTCLGCAQRCSVAQQSTDGLTTIWLLKFLKIKAAFLFFFFFLQRNIAASHLLPGPHCQASSGRGAAATVLNSKIVSLCFSAIFCSENGDFFFMSWQWLKKWGSKCHRVYSNTCHCLGSSRAAQRGAFWGTAVEKVCPDEEAGAHPSASWGGKCFLLFCALLV